MARILRFLRGRFGISARRVSVTAHVPWYWRWLGLVLLGLLVVGVGWATYDFGMEFAGFHQSEATRALARLNEELRRRDVELTDLRGKAAAADRQLQIERATYGDLSRQIKALTEENAGLREDLAFFQSLMPNGKKQAAGVSINRVRVKPEAVPGEYQYRLLLVQTGERVKEFTGKLQLVINVEQAEKKYVLVVPPEHSRNEGEFELNFKFFQRVEGSFKVPADAVVRSLQVRVFEIGASTPKLTQTVKVG